MPIGTAVDSTIGYLCQNFSFFLLANDRAERVASFFCSLCGGSFSGTSQTLKSFKLPTFWLIDLTSGSRGWLKQKDIFFWGNKISRPDRAGG
jgi:hypothetical protein